MLPAPVPEPVVPSVGIVADLHLEVGDGARRTRARLTGGPRTLVLDIDDPVTLLHSVPRIAGRPRLPAQGMTDLLSGTTIRVRSRGSELGRVSFEAGRRPAVRPTGAGVGMAARQALSWLPVRIVGGLIAAALVAARVFSVRRHTKNSAD